jgi:hypothetical protein
MAESVALAVLENLVHMSRADFPTGYVCATATIPDSVFAAGKRELRLRVEHGLPPALPAIGGSRPANPAYWKFPQQTFRASASSCSIRRPRSFRYSAPLFGGK